MNYKDVDTGSSESDAIRSVGSMSVGIHGYNKDNIEYVLRILDTFLPMLLEAGGIVYGGFVRDVLVRRYCKKHQLTSSEYKLASLDYLTPAFKDVDVWWKTETGLGRFLTFLESVPEGRFKLQKVTTLGVCEVSHGELEIWKCSQYLLLDRGVCIAVLDFAVGEEFPVNDFEENCLVYEYIQPGTTQDGTPFAGGATFRNMMSEKSRDEIVKSILEKKLHPLPGYVCPEERRKRFEAKDYTLC